MDDQLLTVNEAADRLAVSHMTVRRLIDAQQLRCYRIRGILRVPASALRDYLVSVEQAARGASGARSHA